MICAIKEHFFFNDFLGYHWHHLFFIVGTFWNKIGWSINSTFSARLMELQNQEDQARQ